MKAVLVVLALSSSYAFAEHIRCAHAKDCVKTLTVCGEATAVLKSHLAEYEKGVAKTQRDNPNPCIVPPSAHEKRNAKVRVVCVEHSCKVR